MREIELDPTSEYQSTYTYSGDGTIDIWLKYYEAGDVAEAPSFEGWACSADNKAAIPARDTLYSRIGNIAPLEDSEDYTGYVNMLATYKNSVTGAVVYYDIESAQWYEYGYAIEEPEANADKTKGYKLSNGNIAVYKSDYEIWTEVSDDPTNLYYQFNTAQLSYIPYHFKKEANGDYTLISRWVNDPSFGHIYYHGDETHGCFDRWMEAKKAISAFSEKLLSVNPNNDIALVPFSKRDHNMISDMNYRSAYRDRIIETNPLAFSTLTGVTVGENNVLSGTYNSRVNWTDGSDDAAKAEKTLKIDKMLDCLFTTANTDYVYGLSMAYNMLEERSPEAKETKQAVVLFISDGVPYSQGATITVNGQMVAMYNPDPHIYSIAEFIKEPAGAPIKTDAAFWTSIQADYVPDMHAGAPYNATTYEADFLNRANRHDMNRDYLMTNEAEPSAYIGAYGKGAQIITVGYMIEEEERGDDLRLKNMATDAASYINIPPSPSGSIEGYLTEQLLNSSMFPGGRNSVLRDVISKYFYIPEDAELPDGVTVEGTIEDGQTLVWDIGNIYSFQEDLTITVPLVLREEYRDVDQITYYPTNADDPEPSLYEPYEPGTSNAPDGPDTGSKLFYTDPEDNDRYDTIGTPKLEVTPPAPTGTANAAVSGTKNVVGWTGSNQTYHFALTELTDSSPSNIKTGSTLNKTATVTGSGEFSFNLTGLGPGTYWFKVTETDNNGNALVDSGGWTYSKNILVVKIEVSDNKKGGYDADVTYPGDTTNKTFINSYIQPATSVTISGSKTVNAGAPEATFTFSLTQVANAQGGAYTGTPITRTATRTGAGAFSFEPITGLTAGTYYFSVKETIGGGTGWTNDTAARIVTVTVSGDPLNAVYNYTTGSSIFNNTFTPTPGEIGLTLIGTKTVSGGSLSDGQFNFAVYEGNNIVATGTNTAAGVIRFSEIRYTAAGTHTYTVRETSVSNDRWTIDSTVHTVTVTVRNNGDGTLTATPAYPTSGLVFNNIYTPPDDNVSLTIRKSLVDSSGNTAGTGKKFAVNLYDAQMVLVGRYILSANEGSTVIDDLESGTVYYLQEEEGDGFTIIGFEIIGVGEVGNSAIGLRIPTYRNQLEIEVIVKNRVDNLEEIPDDPPPLGPYDPPESPPLIDIPDERPPLGPPETGDNSHMTLWLIVCAVSVSSLAMICLVKRRIGKQTG